ncbi:MAG: sensor histidine kinase [Solirubrobacterales bacterium]
MRVAPWRLEIAAVAFWAALVGLSLVGYLASLDERSHEVAVARARVVFAIVEMARTWNASHGGLYAPVTADTPPNPWLDDPERDVVINGRPYTKLNPAYMTRQLSEMMSRDQGVSFRITSLNPIRPANAADPWETVALRAFEAGTEEVVERTDYLGQDTFRYMARLKVREPCMACHRKQGYKVGDVRGGISVSIPAELVLDEFRPQRRQAIGLHLGGFILLAGASLLFLARLRESWTQLAEAKAQQERIVHERTAALRAANAELERSNAELENFAYVASHDLQEPLRMMSSYAQLIERRYGAQLDAEGHEFIAYMTDGAARMKAMIDDLLAYSRVGRGEPGFEAVDTRVAAEIALANLAAALTEAGAEVSLPAALPTLPGQQALLVRLFQNLIGNAIKYRRPDQAPRISLTARKEGGEWHFAVTDNGIGVPPEARERIFAIFQRLHNHGAYPGTGIGLAICRKIVELHGGRIWAEAAEGGGTTFRFTLPAACPLAAAPGDVAGPQQGRPDCN